MSHVVVDPYSSRWPAVFDTVRDELSSAFVPVEATIAHIGSTSVPVHVHAVERGVRLWREHLAFRDALRADAGLCARYRQLKLGLHRGEGALHPVRAGVARRCRRPGLIAAMRGLQSSSHCASMASTDVPVPGSAFQQAWPSRHCVM